MDQNLRGRDPDRVGHSLANMLELLVALLEAAGARSVVEVGSYAGDLTAELLAWAQASGARVTAIDPEPQPALAELAEPDDALTLLRQTSHEALAEIPAPDAVIVDGDHNYYTVSEELRLIAERAEGRFLPLIVLHDVLWPHGRRDAYAARDRVPAEHRNPVAESARLFPGEEGIADGGLPYPAVAEREGGPRNGVMTAIDDFLEDRDDVSLAIVPAFFGVAVLWPTAAPWADEVARILEPLDRNPILARLEANRVFHIAREHDHIGQVLDLQQRLEHEPAPERVPEREPASRGFRGRDILTPDAGAESDRHWQRIVLNRAVDAYIAELPPERCTATEISGESHSGKPWREYSSLMYPEFDLAAPLEQPGTYDVVICEQVLEHIADLRAAVANLRGLCAPGGHVIVSTPFLVRVHELLMFGMRDFWRFTPNGLRRLLEDAGLEVETVEGWGNRKVIEANFSRWAAYRPWHSLRNEPDFPIQVWAFARNPA